MMLQVSAKETTSHSYYGTRVVNSDNFPMVFGLL